jgi:hypothetical protein
MCSGASSLSLQVDVSVAFGMRNLFASRGHSAKYRKSRVDGFLEFVSFLRITDSFRLGE